MEIDRGKTYQIVLAGILVAMGVLLPLFTAHAFGIPGTVLLPMHIPVFLMGFLCGPKFGAVGGVVIPILSSVLTGMPVAFPMLPIMIGELSVYGGISGFLYKKIGLAIYPSLIIAMCCGKLTYGLIFSMLLFMNDGKLQALSMSGAILQGIPGIVIQLIFVPAILVAIKKWFYGENHSKL